LYKEQSIESLIEDVMEIGQHDATLAWVDATSFIIMKRARIRLVYIFDHHFAVVGFRMVT